MKTFSALRNRQRETTDTKAYPVLVADTGTQQKLSRVNIKSDASSLNPLHKSSEQWIHVTSDNKDYLGRWARQTRDNTAGVAQGSSALNIGLAQLLWNRFEAGSTTPPTLLDIKNLPNSVFEPKPNPHWANIASFHPEGHLPDSSRSITIASTPVRMDIPEIKQALAQGRLQEDSHIIQGGQVHATKVAIDYTYDLEGLVERLNHYHGTEHSSLTIDDVRNSLYGASHDELLKSNKAQFFQPAIDGPTVYIFGDPATIDSSDNITVRIQNSCASSDVFHSDICSCRPNLMFGLEEAVKTAQEGGVGIVIYISKEGRGLGQITKFTVYNRRSTQAGGDTADQYFDATKEVMNALSGVPIKDATRPELEAPDVLKWLNINTITHLVTENMNKVTALEKQGINVECIVPMPSERIPKAALEVEMAAKRQCTLSMREQVYPKDLRDKSKDSQADSEPNTDPIQGLLKRLSDCFVISDEWSHTIKNAVIFGLMSMVISNLYTNRS